MARTNGALFSMEASGKFGDAIVFDKRGFAKFYKKPTDSKTETQGNNRQMTGTAQKSVKAIGDTTKMLIAEAAVDAGSKSYRWNSYLVKIMLGPNYSILQASRAIFAALTPAEKDTWEAEANSLNLATVSLDYAVDAAMTPGEQLFSQAKALYSIGIHSATGDPDGTNATAWATAIAS